MILLMIYESSIPIVTARILVLGGKSVRPRRSFGSRRRNGAPANDFHVLDSS